MAYEPASPLPTNHHLDGSLFANRRTANLRRLLISSANTYRSTVQTEYKQILADIIHLDEYLRAYGPE